MPAAAASRPLDDRRGLRVGPQSAGAEPGPACYGQGGAEPTVTDANVVLGRIDPARVSSAARCRSTSGAARRAIGPRCRAARSLNSDRSRALAIVKIAVLKMSLAVRQVSVERGYDPRDFAHARVRRRGAAARGGGRADAAHSGRDRAARFRRSSRRPAC